MKKTLIAAALMLTAAQAIAGGVTVHNYSGKPVQVIAGTFDLTGPCTWQSREGCGGRWLYEHDWSESRGHFIPAGGKVYIEDNVELNWYKPGGYMQIFAATIKKGDHSAYRRQVWHGGVTQIQDPSTRVKRAWQLCTRLDYLRWNKKAKTPSSAIVRGVSAYNPQFCDIALPHYLYTNTAVAQYDLVLTPENARWETR